MVYKKELALDVAKSCACMYGNIDATICGRQLKLAVERIDELEKVIHNLQSQGVKVDGPIS